MVIRYIPFHFIKLVLNYCKMFLVLVELFAILGIFELRVYGTPRTICHDDCNRRGLCTKWGTCECYDGYDGNACERKVCPYGPEISGVAYATDSAHPLVACSSQGTCDTDSGRCICRSGYFGSACEKTSCFNDCSGRGVCTSLRSAATSNDGYMFNRTTTYTRWDADLMFGCKCDPGWSGADCSERSCEYGLDPRLSGLDHEEVTLVCQCDAACSGKFKFSFMGTSLSSWLYPTSTASDLTAAIMKTPNTYTDNSGHAFVPVSADSDHINEQLCANATTTRTILSFTRSPGDIPAVSFYANLFSGGSLFFETTQALTCDCTKSACDGSFRLSFDGEMSEKFDTLSNTPFDITTSLANMATVQNAAINVVDGSASDSLCTNGAVVTTTFTMEAPFGNVPLLGLWASVFFSGIENYYSTNSTSNLLTISTNDGRGDNVKICNGIGECDFSNGVCTCPFGWTFDADVGACGKLEVNTSQWGGLARCPGTVSYFNRAASGKNSVYDDKANYNERIYVSLNPSSGNNLTYYNSYIASYAWNGKFLDQLDSVRFLELTSDTSAGPIVHDQAKDRIFFLDNHPSTPFIGIASIFDNDEGVYSTWLTINYEIYGMALDAHFKRRNLYWTVPARYAKNDGGIYWASIDDTAPPTVNMLAATIGQAFVTDPHGIGVHYDFHRIYWVDRNNTWNTSVLRSCDLDGSAYEQNAIYTTVGNETVSTNLTDLVLDGTKQNTAYFLDAGFPGAIISTNLDFPLTYDNNSVMERDWEDYYTHVLTSHWQIEMNSPAYLLLDEKTEYLLWSDTGTKQIHFHRSHYREIDQSVSGKAFEQEMVQHQIVPDAPVAMMLDRGLGLPRFGRYLECYGNGECLGLEGNWECKCFDGYFGDCQARTCPTGRAWFHEPIVDEIAHDELVECSNMGTCDRGTGTCTCRDGYAGRACERRECDGHGPSGYSCNNRGRCVSMRRLARAHKNEYLEADPVVYGTSAGNPETWDADMVYGCLADEYGSLDGIYNISTYSGSTLEVLECPEGFDRSLRDIRYGDIANYTNYREIQQLKCAATGGYFTLSFRGLTTDFIYATDSLTTFKTAVESLQQISIISLVSTTGTLCDENGLAIVNITFISALGSGVPLLTVTENALSGWPNTVEIRTVQRGAPVKLDECAGRGFCDAISGRCSCWDHYGPSDGAGGAGIRGDCGFRDIS